MSEAETTPQAPTPSTPFNWKLYIGWIVALILLIYSACSTYSYKKVSDTLAKSSNVYQSAVTVTVPMEVAGKIAYKTIIKTVHDNSVSSTETKVTTTIKSGCTLGLLYSTTNHPGVYLSPDILAFGPGNLQVIGEAFSGGELIGGAGYRLNF